MLRRLLSMCLVVLTTLGPIMVPGSAYAAPVVGKSASRIQHLVVIFQENVSFDHYFATYPGREKPAGRAGISCSQRHTHGQRTFRRAADVESQPEYGQWHRGHESFPA